MGRALGGVVKLEGGVWRSGWERVKDLAQQQEVQYLLSSGVGEECDPQLATMKLLQDTTSERKVQVTARALIGLGH